MRKWPIILIHATVLAAKIFAQSGATDTVRGVSGEFYFDRDFTICFSKGAVTMTQTPGGDDITTCPSKRGTTSCVFLDLEILTDSGTIKESITGAGEHKLPGSWEGVGGLGELSIYDLVRDEAGNRTGLAFNGPCAMVQEGPGKRPGAVHSKIYIPIKSDAFTQSNSDIQNRMGTSPPPPPAADPKITYSDADKAPVPVPVPAGSVSKETITYSGDDKVTPTAATSREGNSRPTDAEASSPAPRFASPLGATTTVDSIPAGVAPDTDTDKTTPRNEASIGQILQQLPTLHDLNEALGRMGFIPIQTNLLNETSKTRGRASPVDKPRNKSK